MYSIRSVTTPDFTDQHWQAYYELLQELKRRYHGPCSVRSGQELKERIHTYLQHDEHFHKGAIFEDDRQVGWINFQGRNVGTADQLVYPNFDMLDEQVPEECAHLLSRWILDLLEKYDAKETWCMAWRDTWVALAEAWGGSRFAWSNENVLYRVDANREVIEGWLRDLAPRFAHLRLEWKSEMDDDLFARYIALFQEAIEDMPEDSESGMSKKVDPDEYRRQMDSDRAAGLEFLHLLAFDGDELIGISEVLINQKNPSEVFQLMTTVARSHRKQGIAKWLKALIFDRLDRENPEFELLSTWMRAINEPIQAINRQMGYVLRRRGQEYKVPRAGIEAYLAAADG